MFQVDDLFDAFDRNHRGSGERRSAALGAFALFGEDDERPARRPSGARRHQHRDDEWWDDDDRFTRRGRDRDHARARRTPFGWDD